MDKTLPINEKRFFRLLLSLAGGETAGGCEPPEITEKNIIEELFWLISEHFSGDAAVTGTRNIVLTFSGGEIFDLSVRRR